MRNLTPEQRPDKNGNVVTRWIKSLSSGIPGVKKPIVPPAPSASEMEAIGKREEVMSRFFPYTRDRFGVHLRKNVAFIAENPEIIDFIDTTDTIASISHWQLCIQNDKLHADTPDEHDRVIERCRRKGTLLPFVNQLTEMTPNNKWRDGPNLRKFAPAVEQLSEGMSGDEWDSKHEALTIACFLKEDHTVDEFYEDREIDWGSYEDFSEIVDYIRANREQVDEVLPELFRRGPVDLELLKMMAESPSDALREGDL